MLRDQQSFKAIHDQWLAKDAWIIDGVGYWDELISRLDVSGLVIFLDVPASRCKQQALTRIAQERESPNPNIAPGCRYSEVVDLQLKVIESFDTELKPKLLELLAKLDTKKVRVIHTGEELGIV